MKSRPAKKTVKQCVRTCTRRHKDAVAFITFIVAMCYSPSLSPVSVSSLAPPRTTVSRRATHRQTRRTILFPSSFLPPSSSLPVIPSSFTALGVLSDKIIRTSTSSENIDTSSKKISSIRNASRSAINSNNRRRNNKNKKYRRKREKPLSERESDSIRRVRQQEYEQLRKNTSNGIGGAPSVWSFESLFPKPITDKDSVNNDLYSVAERDKKTVANRKGRNYQANTGSESPTSSSSSSLPQTSYPSKQSKQRQLLLDEYVKMSNARNSPSSSSSSVLRLFQEPKLKNGMPYEPPQEKQKNNDVVGASINSTDTKSSGPVDVQLTRKVEESVYGYRRTPSGDFYDTSLVKDGAVQFRDGRRLGRALPINCDRLNYFAKTELRHNKFEEAQELYEEAINMDPTDGRAYLGLSRIAERRRDFKGAKELLRLGIRNSRIRSDGSAEIDVPDHGANPFLLQALGCLEEKMGNLSEAEELYVAAVKSRPSHAAAWVSLAQLRTQKLRMGAVAGRICYQTAERELQRAGKKPSSYVYTAWATLESKIVGDARRGRELLMSALECDPKCSVAYLQLGLLESSRENYDKAEENFEKVLKFDQRNSRVLQAYAIMESKRPEGDSRKAIELFERALRANPRDAGVLQAYALYCERLGDVDSARDLLQRGSKINKRHAPVWTAWGVLETRYGSAEVARDIFQQGIWACAQLTGAKSGGYHCARLWQAWGVLEGREGDCAAARRCFSRALDADNCNVATITAWATMEEQNGHLDSARIIFERGLKQFPSSSDAKMTIWRAYELMEQRAGHTVASQQIYQRYMRETLTQVKVEQIIEAQENSTNTEQPKTENEKKRGKANSDNSSKNADDYEVAGWRSEASSMPGEVWMNKGSIEGKVPESLMKKKKRNKSQESPSLNALLESQEVPK